MTLRTWIAMAAVAALALAGCADDDGGNGGGADVAEDGAVDGATDGAPTDTAMDAMDTGGGGDAMDTGGGDAMDTGGGGDATDTGGSDATDTGGSDAMDTGGSDAMDTGGSDAMDVMDTGGSDAMDVMDTGGGDATDAMDAGADVAEDTGSDATDTADGAADVPTDDGGGPPTPTWTQDVQPVLAQYCAGCHGAGGCTTGRCWLDSHASVTNTANNAGACGGSRADCIPKRINNGSMPPGGCTPGTPGCISVEELALVEAWIAGGAPE